MLRWHTRAGDPEHEEALRRRGRRGSSSHRSWLRGSLLQLATERRRAVDAHREADNCDWRGIVRAALFVDGDDSEFDPSTCPSAQHPDIAFEVLTRRKSP